MCGAGRGGRRRSLGGLLGDGADRQHFWRRRGFTNVIARASNVPFEGVLHRYLSRRWSGTVDKAREVQARDGRRDGGGGSDAAIADVGVGHAFPRLEKIKAK